MALVEAEHGMIRDAKETHRQEWTRFAA